MMNGKAVWAFSQNSYGQILADLVDDRWVDAETAAQLGIAANENPNASYPRLVYWDESGSHNNYRASTYWMRDCSYVRLKNLEVGYTLPREFTSRIHFGDVRFYVQGANLLTFSSFKLWDPEMGSSNGESYPLTKSITAGVQINL
jgi:hypothetical protein